MSERKREGEEESVKALPAASKLQPMPKVMALITLPQRNAWQVRAIEDVMATLLWINDMQ